MKNIISFDLETTGLNKQKDHIIQIGCVKFNPETFETIDTFNEYVRPEGSYVIAIAAYFKHGITPEFLADKPTLRELAPKLIEFIGDDDILTYNGTKFDIDFLVKELSSVGFDIDFIHRKCYDAFMEEKRRHPNTLEGTFERYTGKTMEDFGLSAHDALSDVKATIEVFKNQIAETGKMYDPEQMFGEDGVITIMNFQNQDVPCFAIGKYRGVSIPFVKNIDMQYLNWCLSDKCNFSPRTKEYIKSQL